MSSKEYDLIKAIKNHWTVSILILLVSVIATTWTIFEKTQLNPLTKELEETRVKLGVSNNEKKKLNNTLKMSKEEISKINQQFTETKNELILVEKKLSEKADSLSLVVLKLEKKEKEFNKINNDLEKTKESLKETSLKIKEKEVHFTSINIELETTKNELSKVMESLAKKRSEIELINDELEKTKISLNDSLNEFTIAQKNLEGALRNSEKYKESSKELSRTLEKINSDFNNAKMKLEELTIPKIVDKIQSNILNTGKYQNKDLKLTASTYESDEAITVDFYLEHKVYFPSGKYILRDAYEQAGMIKAIDLFVSKIKQLNLEYSKLEITGVFEGGADTFLYDKKIGDYKGEYGTVFKRGALINGAIKDIQIYKGDKITNSDLAFLRAFGVYKAFEGLASSNALVLTNKGVEFKANEYKKSGREYRFGKISVKIHKIRKNIETVRNY